VLCVEGEQTDRVPYFAKNCQFFIKLSESEDKYMRVFEFVIFFAVCPG